MADPEGSRRLSVPGAVRAALARPRAWSAIWVVQALLAGLPALAWFGWLRSTVDHRYAPDELFADLGTVFRFDHRAGLGQMDSITGHAGAVLALVFMLLGVFTAGGWLTTFLAPRPQRTLSEFLGGGARFFGRFLRVWLLTILLLSLATWIVRGAPWERIVLGGLLGVPESDYERLETLRSEQTVFLARGAQAVLHALAVGLVLVWGDYTRTRLALFDTRSALWAGTESAFFVLRHPVRALLPMAGLLALEVAVLAALGIGSNAIDEGIGSLADVALLLVLGQIALWARIVLRGARYHAAVAVSHASVRPIAKPDPWGHGRLA